MKELSSVDLCYLVKELQFLVGAKVDQVYHTTDLFFRVHVPSKGKHMLRITNRFLHLTDLREQGENSHFGTVARKLLKNASITLLEQVGTERLVHIQFQKENTFHLYIELFAKGSFVLCDEQNNVIIAVPRRKKDEVYELNAFDLSKLEEKDIVSAFKDTEVVKALASAFRIGGVYAEHILEKTESLTKKDMLSYHKKALGLYEQEMSPCEREGRLFPFTVSNTTSLKKSYNEAIDHLLSQERKQAQKKQALSPLLKEKEQVENIVKQQERAVKKLEKQIKEAQEKGDFIYEHYAEIESLLKEVQAHIEKSGWSTLKNSKKIKRADPKTKRITFTLPS